MSFEVDPAAIRAYAAQFPTHAGDADAMHSYATSNTHLTWHESGIINYMRTAHETFAAAVIEAFAHLHELLLSSKTELDGVATFYERTDHAAAAKLDDTYQQVPRPSRQDTR